MGLFSHEASQAPPKSAAVYVRHRPETTLLYQVVQEYWPEFQAELASHGRYLPAHFTKEFDEYLKHNPDNPDSHGSPQKNDPGSTGTQSFADHDDE